MNTPLPQYGPVALAAVHQRVTEAIAKRQRLKQNIRHAACAVLLVSAFFGAIDAAERIANWSISRTQPAEQTSGETHWRN